MKEILDIILAIATPIVLFLTFGAIIWYSFETKRLADLTKKQIKIDIRPVVVVTLEQETLRLKNIGRSPALNITVKDISWEGEGIKYRFEFHRLEVLQGGDSKTLGISLYKNEEPCKTWGSGIVSEIKRSYLQSALGRQEVTVDYDDIEGGRWVSKSTIREMKAHFKEVKEGKSNLNPTNVKKSIAREE